MRNRLLATAAVSLTTLATPVLPASADTVVRRETTIITREEPADVVEYRTYRAPEVRYYSYSAPRRHYYAPRSETYAYGAPVYGYNSGYTYAADGSCGWLYRRAINTGSPYWWNRYNDCVD